MKNKLQFILCFTILFFVSCAEKRKSDNSSLLLPALSIINGCGTTPTTISSIGSTNRVQYDFSNCNNPSALSGFIVSSITPGLTGTSANSKLASIGTYGSSSNKINIEVTFTLNSPNSYLDIIAMGSGTGTELSGPGFRISPNDVKYIPTSGSPTSFGTGNSPTNTVGILKSLCLEVHQEGSGSHIFGWDGACSTVINRGVYNFEEANVAGSISDRKIGFTLNNVILTQIIVSNGNLGTAGSIQNF